MFKFGALVLHHVYYLSHQHLQLYSFYENNLCLYYGLTQHPAVHAVKPQLATVYSPLNA